MMKLHHLAGDKDQGEVQIENTSDPESNHVVTVGDDEANVQVEGEFFKGINKQTILAFLVSSRTVGSMFGTILVGKMIY